MGGSSGSGWTGGQRYRVKLTRKAAQEFKALPETMKIRVGREFDELERAPRHPGVIKLTGSEELYRVRAGDF